MTGGRKRQVWLLELHFGTGGLELLLDFLGLGLVDAFLDGLGGAFDEVLGFLEAQAGDGSNFLDGADLVRASLEEDDGELGLFLDDDGGAGSSSDGGAGGSGGGNAPLGLQLLDEAGEFENRLAREPFDDLVFGDIAHGGLLKWIAVSVGETRLRDVSPSLLLWILCFPGLRRKICGWVKWRVRRPEQRTAPA